MSDTVINLKGVTKYYRLYSDPKDRLKEALNPFRRVYHSRHYALQSIDLEVRRGDILGVVGRNGCGKSTLLKIITKVLTTNAGSVSVNGKITALLELGAGFNPEFSGIDNIKFYASVLGISHEEIESKLDDITDFAELGEYLYQPVKTYSSGMKARLGFAVAAHVEPDILILDEVLAVGDALFRRKCYAKMEEFFKQGKTVIYVSHNSDSVNRLCNRAILIHGGKIVMDGKPREVTKMYDQLLFSADADLDQKIKTIVKENRSDGPPVDELLIQRESPRRHESLDQKPYFIENYDSKAMVKYPSNGADVMDCWLETMGGDKVNVLITGERYRWCYDVLFDRPVDKISFGMKIKGISGAIISEGSLHSSGKPLFDVDKDSLRVLVSWSFQCNLLASDYFMNCGVSRHHEGGYDFMVRIVDACAFKVISKRDRLASGIVDLRQELSVLHNGEVRMQASD